MTCKETLLYLLKTSQFISDKLIDDVSEEDSLVRGRDQSNHIRWQVGHLVYFGKYILFLAGQGDESFRQLEGDFGYKSVVRDDGSGYLALAELKEQLADVHRQLYEFVEKASDGELDKIVDEKKGTPVAEQIAFWSLHETYHAGQIIPVGKALGRERPFG
ncbi:MAG: DinB family protein [bacterium]